MFASVDIESSTESAYFGSPKIILDSSGKPMVVYLRKTGTNESIIKLATSQSPTWSTATIYSSVTGSTFLSHYLAADTDSSGNPHIVFSGGLYQIDYLYKSGSTWATETIDSDVLGYFRNFDIKIDNSDVVHVVYQNNFTHGSMYRYATKEGSGDWIKYDIPSAEGSTHAYYAVTLQIDKNEYPHIFYEKSLYPENSKELHYAQFNGTTWEVQRVATLEGDTAWDFKLDDNDRPHIAYYSLASSSTASGSYQIFYSYYDSSAWQTEEIDQDSLPGPICLALDSSDNPRLIFNGSEDVSYRGRYAIKTASGSWEKNQIKENILAIFSTSFLLDGSDNPQIVTTNYSAPDALQYYYLRE